MKKNFAYGIVAVTALLIMAVFSVAQVYSVYNPIEKRNVPIDQVSMDEIKAWASAPSFSKWTNLEGLREYLADKGVSLDELREESAGLSNRDVLGLRNTDRVIKSIQRLSLYSDGEAVTEIECDKDDGEMSFELKNVGQYPWFLVDQELTTGSNGKTKYLSGALSEAKAIKFYVNSFPANSYSGKYWRGEKLFYPEGESFATACEADFLRKGKTVRCDLKPIPVREGSFIKNTYKILAPTFVEQGQFTCE